MDWYEVTERLALTEDDRVVPEESVEARWLYAIPGTRIAMAEAVRYGLVQGAEEPLELVEPLPEADAPSEPVEGAEEPVGLRFETDVAEPVKRPRGRPRKAQG